MAALKELSERLERTEARLDAMERKPAPEGPEGRDDICVECSALVGCLDDCCEDPEEVRERVRDVRSAGRGN